MIETLGAKTIEMVGNAGQFARFIGDAMIACVRSCARAKT